MEVLRTHRCDAFRALPRLVPAASGMNMSPSAAPTRRKLASPNLFVISLPSLRLEETLLRLCRPRVELSNLKTRQVHSSGFNWALQG